MLTAARDVKRFSDRDRTRLPGWRLTPHLRDHPGHDRSRHYAMPSSRTDRRSDRNRQANSVGCRSSIGATTRTSKSVHALLAVSIRLSVCLSTHHQRLDIRLQPIIVETLERLSVIQLILVRVARRSVLTQNVEPQLVRPPVTVLRTDRQGEMSSTIGLASDSKRRARQSDVHLSSAHGGVCQPHWAFRRFLSGVVGHVMAMGTLVDVGCYKMTTANETRSKATMSR